MNLTSLVSGIVRTVTWLIVTALVLLASYVGIGRLAVSRLQLFTPFVESMLGEVLQSNVSIGSLSGGWYQLNPRLEVTNLTFGDPDSTAVDTKVGRLSVELDVLTSLRFLKPFVNRLELDEFRTRVRRSKDGSWEIAGMTLPPSSGEPYPVLDQLLNIESARISNIDIVFELADGKFRITADEPFEIDSNGIERSLHANIMLMSETGKGGYLSVTADYQGDPRKAEQFRAEVLLTIDHLPAHEFIGGQFDFDVDSRMVMKLGDGKLEGMLEFSIPEVQLSNEVDQLSAISEFKAMFQVAGHDLSDWQLNTGAIDFVLDGKAYHFDDGFVRAFQHAEKHYLVGRLDHISLGPILENVLALDRQIPYLPERGRALLRTMQPKGNIEDIFIAYSPGQAPTLVGKVVDANIKAYLGSPYMSDIRGLISVTPTSAFINFYMQDIRVGFHPMFDETWDVDSAAGRIDLDYSRGYVMLSSKLLEVVVDDMIVRGKVQLNLTRDRRYQNWGLVIGIRNAELAEKDQYIPNTLNATARDWITTAVRSGHINQSGLLFHGTLFGNAPQDEKVYEMFFDFEDGELVYDSEWPKISGLNANAYVANWGVEVQGATGEIFSSKVRLNRVFVPLEDGKLSVVNVDADLTGPTQDGIRFLSETPLAETLGHQLDDWQGKGQIDATMRLQIPIADSFELKTDVVIEMNESDIYMPRYDILLEELDAQLRYTETSGLSSGAFTAKLFNYPVAGRIESRLDGSATETRISFDGTASVADLYDWSKVVILTRAEGVVDYQAELVLAYADDDMSSRIEAVSMLRGVRVDLPPPLAKQANESRDFVYTSTLGSLVQNITISYGREFKAALVMRGDRLDRGHISFGSSAVSAPTWEGIRVSGNLPVLHFEDWEKLDEELAVTYQKLEGAGLDSELAARISRIELQIGRLEIFDLTFENMHSEITRGKDYWLVSLNNEEMKGEFQIPDDDTEPYRANLTYLRLRSESGGEDDPLGDLVPQELVAVEFHTDEFTWDGDPYGAWTFSFRPTEKGAQISNLKATVKGLDIGGESGGELVWLQDDGKHSSSFKGDVATKDLAFALKQWGFASSIESEDFSFNTNISWHGSPVQIEFDNFSGDVLVKARRGRFVQVEAAGALKLLGIFDFASIARRFRFDFSDIVDKGFSFNKIKGRTQISGGMLNITEPVVIEGSSSIFKVGGKVNLVTQELDNDMIVTLPVNRNLPWYAAYSAIATGPLFGAGVFLAQKIFQKQINLFSSAKYKVSGTVDEPNIEFVSIFDDSVRVNETLETPSSESDGT